MCRAELLVADGSDGARGAPAKGGNRGEVERGIIDEATPQVLAAPNRATQVERTRGTTSGSATRTQQLLARASVRSALLH